MIRVMHVDGKIVGNELARIIRPSLRQLGFHKFQGRHAWRKHELNVDLVTFPSMNSYVALGVGCTAYSFGCNVGVYYPALFEWEPVEWPRDYHLTFRGILGKTIRQPFFHPYDQPAESLEEWRRDRADVWYVREDGSNLVEVVEDALRAVLDLGVPFIDRVDIPHEAMQSLLTEKSTAVDFGRLALFAGAIGSPSRLRSIELLAPFVSGNT
jgi:hypothetical protein